MHAADAGAVLEAQRLVVAQHLGDEREVVGPDVEGDLATVDDDLLDPADQVGLAQPRLEGVGHLVVPAAVGALAGPGEDRGLDQPAVPTGVTAAGDAEHALPDAHGLDLAGLDQVG